VTQRPYYTNPDVFIQSYLSKLTETNLDLANLRNPVLRTGCMCLFFRSNCSWHYFPLLDWFDEITLVLVLLKKKKKKAECVVRFAQPINSWKKLLLTASSFLTIYWTFFQLLLSLKHQINQETPSQRWWTKRIIVAKNRALMAWREVCHLEKGLSFTRISRRREERPLSSTVPSWMASPRDNFLLIILINTRGRSSRFFLDCSTSSTGLTISHGGDDEAG